MPTKAYCTLRDTVLPESYRTLERIDKNMETSQLDSQDELWIEEREN